MTIAAASCAKIQQTPVQSVWKDIAEANPDGLVLLGDNIYLENDNHLNPQKLQTELRKLYTRQFNEQHFAGLIAQLRARNAPVLGIYDDHDFLGNNRYGADHDPQLRQTARDEFSAWFNPAKTGDDVYSLTRVGPVSIAVLDERYYRSRASKSDQDRDAILGSDQWLWLENVVRSADTPYLMIASSSTFHRWRDESWEDYPAAFERMRDLLRNRSGRFILSGDIHRNAAYDDSGVIEIVTSGVARNGLIFGTPRRNYALLTFHQDHLHVELRSNKASWRFDFGIPLNRWELQ